MLGESHFGKVPTAGAARLMPGSLTRPVAYPPAPAPTRPQRHVSRTPRHVEPPPTAHPEVPHPAVPHPGTQPPPVWAPAGKREARHLAALLARGEPVNRMAQASYRNRKGLLILTSQRLLFMRDRWNGAMAEEFHLASVSSITCHETGSSARVVVNFGGQVSEITNIDPADAGMIVQEAQRILSHVRATVSPELTGTEPAEDVTTTPDSSVGAPAAPGLDLPAESTPSGGPTGTIADAATQHGSVPPPPPARAPEPELAVTGQPMATGPSDADSLMANLRELCEMRNAGALDDYEFAMAKARLLAQPNSRG